MPLDDLLVPGSVLPALKVNGKKQAVQELSARAAAVTGLPERDVFDAVLQRERLGSTGIGAGIAIPHCKLAKVAKLHGVFARLEKPIDFDALDGEPVDLIFLLVAPEAAGADHLKALARMARLLRDPAITSKLRATRDADGIFALLTQQPAAA
ncbi:MAG: PTS IIA-like nitrogen regulatory protein PtsN [Hyphomicrobiales bacterium]|nr:PTS IIA-like nitrogen regulatory protein PtsN [Hyphomicrobiales bacterium]MBV9113557.1 PTS IIA-like nitrogen regulatory protein PtsN [Hyphomicrobiales bacterium]MBV9518304.1 PTS IIA-like nitrogen regulatory protein PtsN [Hyphomicrobiales bacterium]